MTEILELRDVHTSPFGPIGPAEVCYVRNGHSVSHDPRAILGGSLRLFSESIFEHLVQAFGLRLVALDAVLDFLGSVSIEMICLTLKDY